MDTNNLFLKPRLISDEMCEFMGIPLNSKRSQTDVTKYINSYIKCNNCYDPTFKRRIIPDSKLKKNITSQRWPRSNLLKLTKFLET